MSQQFTSAPNVDLHRLRRRLGDGKYEAYKLARELHTAYHLLLRIAPKIIAASHAKGRAAAPSRPQQSMLRWGDSVPGVATLDGLIACLKRHSVHFTESYHSLYIPPQRGLDAAIGPVVHSYPPDAGFKIVKNFGPPETTSYLWDATSRWVTRRLIGSMTKLVEASNVLYVLGLGPRLYDLIELFNDKVRMTCLVVQHVDGVPPDEADHAEFMTRLSAILEGDLRDAIALAPPDQLRCDDFRSPDCGGNLIKRRSDGTSMYVDPQQFIIVDGNRVLSSLLHAATDHLHFGETRFFRGGRRYLYQAIPGVQTGKRDSQARWLLLTRLLQDASVDLADRVVLDIGCNSGMMLGLALSAGARWGIGWDRPSVIPETERVQVMLGNTRTSFFPANLTKTYSLPADVPTWLRDNWGGSVVFYLAVWKYFGCIESLRDVPWKALVYEGHEEDTAEQTARNMVQMQDVWHCRLAATATITDGDCGTRTVGLLVRD